MKTKIALLALIICAMMLNCINPSDEGNDTPKQVTFHINNTSGSFEVNEIRLTRNSDANLSKFSCSVPPGTTIDVKCILPSSDSYKIFIYGDGYMATWYSVSLTSGQICSVVIVYGYNTDTGASTLDGIIRNTGYHW